MATAKRTPQAVVSNLRQISVGLSRRNELVYREQGARTLSPTMIVARGGSNLPPISFVFPFPPQQIQYSNLTPEMSEISRPGRVPIIAFNRFRARQIAFKFLMAVPLDGLTISIDSDIQILQEMANTTRPVYFTNLDRQISNPLNVSDELRIFWTITDLNLSSIRRNERNQIVAAEVDITLIENNNPKIKVADLPVLTYTDAPPANTKPKDNKPKPDDVLDYTDGQIRHKANGTTG